VEAEPSLAQVALFHRQHPPGSAFVSMIADGFVCVSEYYFRPGSVPVRYWEWRSRKSNGSLTSSTVHGEPVGVVSYDGVFSQDELLSLEVRHTLPFSSSSQTMSLDTGSCEQTAS
jgi:hypothetical protein